MRYVWLTICSEPWRGSWSTVGVWVRRAPCSLQGYGVVWLSRGTQLLAWGSEEALAGLVGLGAPAVLCQMRDRGTTAGAGCYLSVSAQCCLFLSKWKWNAQPHILGKLYACQWHTPFHFLRYLAKYLEKQIRNIHTVLIMNKFLVTEICASHKISSVIKLGNEYRKLTEIKDFTCNFRSVLCLIRA